MTLLNCLIKKSMDMISQVLLLLLRKRSCHYCTVLSIIVCRCSSIDPADSKFCQNQFINTFRAKHQDLKVPLEGGRGLYTKRCSFLDVVQQIVWFYVILMTKLIFKDYRREGLDFLCNLNYITPTSIYE